MHVATIALIISLAALASGAALYIIGTSEGRGRLEGLGVLVFWLAAVATLVTATVAISAFGGSLSCERKANDMNRDWRYGLATGCRVQSDDGRFVPLDNLLITNEEQS